MTDSGRDDTFDEQTGDASFSQEIEPAPSPAVQETMDQMTDRLQTVIDAAERAAEAIRYDAEAQARQHLAEAQQKADRLTAERVRLIAELTDDLIDHASVVKQHSEQMVGALEQAIQSVSGRIDEVTAEAVPAEEPAPEPNAYTPFPAPPPPRLPEAPVEEPPPPPETFATPLAEPEPEPFAEPRTAPEPEPDLPPALEPEPEPAAEEPAAISGEAQAPAGEPYAEPSTPEPEPILGATAPEAPPTEPAEPAPFSEAETFLGAPDPPPEALLRATQLAVAGSERSEVAEMLSREYGIDPAPVLDRIFGPT